MTQANFVDDSAPAERLAGQHAHPRRAFGFVNPEPFPRKVDRFSPRFVILLLSKGKIGEPAMATAQVKTVRKTAPAARSNPARKTAG
jgi:hypothetical protein